MKEYVRYRADYDIDKILYSKLSESSTPPSFVGIECVLSEEDVRDALGFNDNLSFTGYRLLINKQPKYSTRNANLLKEDQKELNVKSDMYEFSIIPVNQHYKKSILIVSIDRYTRKKATWVSHIAVYHDESPHAIDFIGGLTDRLRAYPKVEIPDFSYLYTLVSVNGNLDLIENPIKPTNINVETNYNDDFLEIHQTITNKLKHENQGIVLLHGKPGTGKTYYLRHLIHTLGKSVIFIPTHEASQLASPNFIPLLMRYPNSVLVIEDSENIIKTRKGGGHSSVSTLLNLADGLLSDVLGMQMICTFNCDINDVDEALMRKGRLIARYEFKELEETKARTLAEKLGFDSSSINGTQTLTDVYNLNDKTFTQERKRIGF